MSSDFNLVLLNLWIGLCRGVDGLPSIFRELGYQDKWIERQVDVLQEDRTVTVHPEMIIFSVETSHTVLVESKAGANTDADQLDRYSMVTADDLRERAFIDRRAVDEIDIGIFGLEEHGGRLEIGLDEEDHPFPLVLANKDGLYIERERFGVNEFDGAFRPMLRVDWSSVPTHFVPVIESSDHWEYAEPVMQRLLTAMCQRVGRLEAEQIAMEVCRSTWAHMGRAGKRTVVNKVAKVLEHAAHHQFSSYLRWIDRAEAVEIENNPIDHDPTQRTRDFKRLQRLTEDFIQDLRGAALQTELFRNGDE